MMAMNKIRDSYWDSLKFYLILLVVLGHTLEIVVTDGSFSRALYNSIYLFHMPLFIFVSGRFSHVKDTKSFNRSIFKLLETLIIFQIIRSFVIPVIWGDNIEWKYLIVPNWILWYLMALIWWRIMIKVTPPHWLYYKKKYVIISAFLISIISGFVPIGHPFEIQRTLAFLPFFVLGYYSKDINITEINDKIPLLVAIAFFCVVFWCFYKYLNFNMAWLLSAGQHYLDTDSPSMIIRVFSRLLWLPCSLIACVMFLKLAQNNCVFANLGQRTMPIFIYHSFVLDVLKYLYKSSYIPISSTTIYLYFIVVFIIVIIMSNMRFFRFSLNLISNTRSLLRNKYS